MDSVIRTADIEFRRRLLIKEPMNVFVPTVTINDRDYKLLHPNFK